MEFIFNRKKAVEAAAILAKHYASKQIAYLRLLKLLYIADRESIRETGRPITGDKVYAMKDGPVLTEIYDWIKGKAFFADWANAFRRDGYFVSLVSDPGVSELSELEIETLNRVSEKYKKVSKWGIRAMTHTFPEWEKYYSGSSSTRIPVKSILKALDLNNEQIEQIAHEHQYFRSVDAFFSEPVR